mgnify:CR=1 FL=1
MRVARILCTIAFGFRRCVGRLLGFFLVCSCISLGWFAVAVFRWNRRHTVGRFGQARIARCLCTFLSAGFIPGVGARFSSIANDDDTRLRNHQFHARNQFIEINIRICGPQGGRFDFQKLRKRTQCITFPHDQTVRRSVPAYSVQIDRQRTSPRQPFFGQKDIYAVPAPVMNCHREQVSSVVLWKNPTLRIEEGQAISPTQRGNALVLLAGELRHFSIEPSAWDHIIAADGGSRHALAQGVMPHVVVGDLDSLSSEDIAKLTEGTRVERVPRDKDFTDGEMAVHEALRRGAKTVVIAGGLGGRLDHTLANIFLLEHVHAVGAAGWVTDGHERAYLLRSGETIILDGQPGDTVSIVPLSPVVEGVYTTGLRWPLSNTDLRFASSLSVSNEMNRPRAQIAARKGIAVVTHTPASNRLTQEN